MNCKTLITIVGLVFATTLTISCSKDEDKVVPSTPQTEILSRQRLTIENLVEKSFSGTYIKNYVGDNEQLISLVKNSFNVVMGMKCFHLDTAFAHRSSVSVLQYKRDWHIETFTFTYPSVSSIGQPIVLSGRVTFPVADDGKGNNVESLSLYVHHYVDHELAPSLCITPFTLRTLYNSAVVEPDLQGYGIDTSHAFCGLSNDALARQMKDCLFAAMQIMRQYNVSLAADGYTTAWGYSLAAPAVMAFIRMHDQQFTESERQSIRLHSAFVGGGPMKMDQLLYFLDQNPDYSARLLRYSIHLYAAMPPSVFVQYELKDFAPEWMHDYIVRYKGRNCTFFYALTQSAETANGWPAFYDRDKLTNNLASDMFKDDGHLDYSNPKCIVLFSVLQQASDWGGWAPSVDVYASHGTDDDAMPYEQAHSAFLGLNTRGTIHWKDAHAGLLGKALDGNHMALTILGSNCMIQYNTPAEAFKKGIL